MAHRSSSSILWGLLLFAVGLMAGALLYSGPTGNAPPDFEMPKKQRVFSAEELDISPPLDPIPVKANPGLQRVEVQSDILLADRVISVAKALRSANTTTYLETYQLTSTILRLPWSNVSVSSDDRFTRINVTVGDQDVRIAFRQDEIFVIYPIDDNLDGSFCRDFQLQLRFIHSDQESDLGFKDAWVSLYYKVVESEDAVRWMESQNEVGHYPGYEVWIDSVDLPLRRKRPDLADPSSTTVWGIGYDEGKYGTHEIDGLWQEGSAVDRALCNEVHQRLRELVLSVRKGEWPSGEGVQFPLPE